MTFIFLSAIEDTKKIENIQLIFWAYIWNIL